MKLWEAMKALEEGKKVRKKRWGVSEFIELDINGNMVDENKEKCQFDVNINVIKDEWEIYEEDENEILQKLIVYMEEFGYRIIEFKFNNGYPTAVVEGLEDKKRYDIFYYEHIKTWVKSGNCNEKGDLIE